MSTAPQINNPPTPPNKYGGDPVAFDTAMQAFLDWMAAAAPQMNTQATWLNQRADTVDAGAAAAGSIGASVSTAAASAAAAAAARDAALAAWVASTTPAETLASVSTGLHSGAIVKAIVYDTSKDSDGGAWRKRTTHTSWYTEALGFTGKWLGQKTNLATAWATSGAAAGDGYQNVADGKFYTLTGTNTASEIFRGNVREFPAVVAVVAESARVVIYDLTQPTCPMWMVFVAGTNNHVRTGPNSLAAHSGSLVIGTSQGVCRIGFASDVSEARSTGGLLPMLGGVSQRNGGLSYSTAIAAGAIVNSTVNDCAITVLDTAPIDAATGLPVPTIAVATAGGVSVIKDDGTVVNSSATASVYAVAFQQSSLFLSTSTGGQMQVASRNVAGLGASWASLTGYTSAGIPAILPSGSNGVALSPQTAFAKGTAGLVSLRENPAAPTKGMVSYITNTYNSGWLVGDIRGAWLADTTAETISASGELVTNGTFATDTSGWTAGNSATLSVATAKLRVTNDGTGTNGGFASQAITTVVGRTYTATVDFTKAGAATAYLKAGTSAGTSTNGVNSATASGAIQLTFIATATTTYISVQNSTEASAYSDFDNISVKLADPDRCVKNKGLIVNGSLTKAAVASGAGLVGYSGFSASNYLEAPYDSGLDFGTGDFCVMGWGTFSGAGAQYFFDRGTSGGGAGGAARFLLSSNSSRWYVAATASGASSTDTGVSITAGLHFVSLVRASGVLYLYVDGAQVYSVANTANLTNTAAVTRIGNALEGGSFGAGGTLALWRISATAPSADQIAHIYRTELPLFQPNAQCTLAGSSTAVTTMAYDDTTTLLHVGTSWGRSSFEDLQRVDSEATTTGSITTVSAQGGVVLTGGTSGKVYMPALLLRDELRRKAESRQALGRVVVGQEFTATAGQTVFVARKGYDVRFVYANGLLKRLTTDYTVSDDGFQKTVTFTSGQLVGVPVTLMLTRSN